MCTNNLGIRVCIYITAPHCHHCLLLCLQSVSKLFFVGSIYWRQQLESHTPLTPYNCSVNCYKLCFVADAGVHVGVHP